MQRPNHVRGIDAAPGKDHRVDAAPCNPRGIRLVLGDLGEIWIALGDSDVAVIELWRDGLGEATPE